MIVVSKIISTVSLPISKSRAELFGKYYKAFTFGYPPGNGFTFLISE